MRRLAGIGIIAGIICAGLGLFFLLGGDWAVLVMFVVTFVGLGSWFAGLVLGAWLWDEVHWALGALVLLLVVVIAPPLILPLASVPWWIAYAMYGFCAAVLVICGGVTLLLKYAIGLIKGDKNAN